MDPRRDAGGLRHVVALSVHTHRFSSEEIVINSDVFAWVKPGDIVAVFPAERRRTDRLALSVGKASVQASKHGVATLKVSVLKSIADRFGLHSMQQVVVSQIDPQQIKLDSLQLTFDSQFLSRSVLWRISQALEGKCLYRGQRLTVLGHKLRVQHMFLNGAEITSGLVESFTKVNFRSRSARIIWLVQMSQEMWDFANDGDIFFEKALKTFFEPCLERWAELNAKHSLTVIFYTRTILNHHSSGLSLSRIMRRGSGFSSPLHERLRKSVIKDARTGCLYEDLFYVVVENETASPWSSLILKLKKAFIAFPTLANWKLASGTRGGVSSRNSSNSKKKIRRRRRKSSRRYSTSGGGGGGGESNLQRPNQISEKDEGIGCGLPSSAANGNFFEALNLALNIFDKHHMDRDLMRTGQALVVVSPGMGLFEADRKLLMLTKRRLLDNGVGIDLLCLNSRPLHRVPLIIYKEDNEVSSQSSSDSSAGQIFYNIPHWLRISFPAQPEPIGDGFSPLPSHRMIDLLPGTNNDEGDAYDDADGGSGGIIAHGRSSIRVPSTLRTFLEDSSEDALEISSLAFSSTVSSLFGADGGGRRNSTKSTKLRKLAHVYRGVTAPQPQAAIAEADDAKQLIQRSQSRLNLSHFGARAHGIIPRPFSMTQMSAAKSRTSRGGGGSGHADGSSGGGGGSGGRMSQLEYRAHDMKVFSAPRYKEGGSSSGGYSGFSGYGGGTSNLSSGTSSGGGGGGGGSGIGGGTSSGFGGGGIGDNSSMMGSASFQNLSGARLMKVGLARSSKFDRSTSRTNRASRRRISHIGSYGDVASASALAAATGEAEGNTSVSNLARSLQRSTEFEGAGQMTGGRNNSRSAALGAPVAGNIVRVQSSTIKWGATLQQAIPKTVLVKPSSSWKESGDGILSTSFPNEKELASFMHLTKADRMAMARGKAAAEREVETVRLQISANTNRNDGPEGPTDNADTKLSSSINSVSESPRISPAPSPQLQALRSSSPTRDRFGSPPRSPGGTFLHNRSPQRHHHPTVSITPLRLGGPAQLADQSEESAGIGRRSIRRSVGSNRSSKRFSSERDYAQTINPFKQKKSQVEHISSSRRRWRHLYTKAFDALRGTGLLSDDPYALDWPSLSIPAILPLTTDYFPTETVLNLEYSITQQYTQCIPDQDELEEMGYTSAEELVRELVCQRLAQDFQIITAHDGAGEKLSGGLKYHLMFRHIIHKLTFDAASRNIEVTIYTHTRKSEALSAASVYYQ